MLAHGDGQVRFTGWSRVGAALKRADAAVQWWIGDWLLYGEGQKWGDKYEAAIEATGFVYGTLRNIKQIANCFELSRRRDNLTFTHHQEAAAAESEKEQDAWLDAAEENEWSAGRLRTEMRKARLEREVCGTEAAESLESLIKEGQRFGTILADPPWRYDSSSMRGAAENHYKTMTTEQIAALPVADVAAEDAHLHLWTTVAFVAEAMTVIAAWGFEYKSMFVWVKPTVGLGNYWRLSHELLLLGVRGRCAFADHTLRSWGEWSRGRHSSKPEQVRGLIERASPTPRLELFGRRLADGWTVIGDQVGATLLADPPPSCRARGVA